MRSRSPATRKNYNLGFLSSGSGYRQARSAPVKWVVKKPYQQTNNLSIFGFKVSKSGDVDQGTGKGNVVVGPGILATCDPQGLSGTVSGGGGDYNPTDWCVHKYTAENSTPLEVEDEEIIWAPIHILMGLHGTSDQQGTSPVEVFSELGINVQWAHIVDPTAYVAQATKPADTYPGGSPYIITFRPLAKVFITGTPKVMRIEQWQIGPIELGPWFHPTNLDVQVTFPP